MGLCLLHFESVASTEIIKDSVTEMSIIFHGSTSKASLYRKARSKISVDDVCGHQIYETALGLAIFWRNLQHEQN